MCLDGGRGWESSSESAMDSLARLVEADNTPFVVCYDVAYFICYEPDFSEVCLLEHTCFTSVSSRYAFI